jgi:hypothetical protein
MRNPYAHGPFSFSRNGIGYRWRAGQEDTMRALTKAPWSGTFDPLEGLIGDHWVSPKTRSVDL